MPLSRHRILVVEDEFLIAEDLCGLLRQAGAEVIGPAASLPQAMRLARDGGPFDAAVLDIDLGGVAVFPLADQLMKSGTPIMFLTGYSEENLPDAYSSIIRCEKPMVPTRVVNQVLALLPAAPAEG